MAGTGSRELRSRSVPAGARRGERVQGDAAQGLASADEESRANGRRLLANTTVGALIAHPIFVDEVSAFADAAIDSVVRRRLEPWTMEALVRFLLDSPEEAIKPLMPGLPSDVIACAAKLVSNDELIAVGRKVFNPLPGSQIGAKGYLGARIQPNSPTDDPDDILMQVLDGWAYAVGDVVLGTNPVSSDVDQVARVELALQGHLLPYLSELREGLATAGLRAAPEHIIVTCGRVRAGYRIGERLFGALPRHRSATVIHLIGERPGNGHHTFSAYLTKLPAHVWMQAGAVDHHHTRVVSNIADTAFDPVVAARETVLLAGAPTTAAVSAP